MRLQGRSNNYGNRRSVRSFQTLSHGVESREIKYESIERRIEKGEKPSRMFLDIEAGNVASRNVIEIGKSLSLYFNFYIFLLCLNFFLSLSLPFSSL